MSEQTVQSLKTENKQLAELVANLEKALARALKFTGENSPMRRDVKFLLGRSKLREILEQTRVGTHRHGSGS
jgi:hypothetical protein